MKFATCIVPYWPHGWTPPPPSVAAWKALASIGITDVRVSAPLHLVFPDRETENWKLLDQFIPQIQLAGLSIYLNPGGCPPWASEGQPAYIGSIAGWPPETPIPPAVWGGTHAWDDLDPTKHDISRIHYFGDPKFAAVDATLPLRPYLTKPPHRDPAFFEEYAGYRLTMRYDDIDSYGVGNEPGAFDSPEMRVLDKAYVNGGSDTIAERFFPEIVEPYSTGVRRAWPAATIVGPEADSADVLDRCCALDDALYRARPPISCYDVLSIHPYGDLIGGSYRTMKAFDEVLKTWKSRRPVRIGEIGGDPQALYDWTVEMLRTHPDLEGIFYLEPSYFFEDGSWPKEPVVSAIGAKFRELFTTIGGK
jgi:hypothetical protein